MAFVRGIGIENRRHLYTELFLVLIGLGGAIFHWYNKAIRGFEIVGDVTEVWIPFANCVLSGGAMYLCHWDNKPPLFHFLNVAFASTDYYLLLFFLTMGLANGVSAILLWRLCRRWGYENVGVVSAVLFVALLAGLTFRVNPRNYAVLFLLLALGVKSPTRSGVSIAIAGLFSQFAVFAIPAVIWIKKDISELHKRWLAMFATAGLMVVVLSYGLVALLWGTDAAITGFRYSFFSSGEYVAGYNERGLSLYGDPIAWIYKLYRLLHPYLWLVIGASAGSYAVLVGRYGPKFGKVVVLVTLLTAFPLTIRTASAYLVLSAPFLSVLFVMGFEFVLDEYEVTYSPNE